MDMLFDQFTDYQSLKNYFVDDFERINKMLNYLSNLQGCDGQHFNLLFEVVNYITAFTTKQCRGRTNLLNGHKE